jgi:tetratricopeptide (TPR) repeat protein
MSMALAAQRYTPPAADIEPVPMRASCAPDANADVDRGVAFLVLLARDEARRAFERAATTDPDCALGYWGQAVSGLPAADEALTEAALEAGAMAARRAASVPAPTPIERGLVQSISALFAPATPTPIGLRLDAYEKSLRALAQAHPDADALTMLQARAVLLRTTLPRDEARQRAIRLLEQAWRDRPLPAGGAVALIEASAGALSPAIARRAADAMARVRLPGARAMVLRALVVVGDWERAALEGEAALSYAGTATAPGLLSGHRGDFAPEPLIESYLQLGRRETARALLTRLYADLARADVDDTVHGALRRGITRAVARVVIDERSKVLTAVTGERADASPAEAWPWQFSFAFVTAWHAWPGGDAERLRQARESLETLTTLRGGDLARDPEIDLAQTLVEAVVAASQDEHPQVALLLTHAADLETRLMDTGRLSLPLQPAREVAAEIWQRFYRYPDAEREARATLERHPNRWRAWLTLARALTAQKRDAESRDAWRRVADLRAKADAGDSARAEAQQALGQARSTPAPGPFKGASADSRAFRPAPLNR